MARLKESKIDIEDQIVSKLEPDQKEITQNLRSLIKSSVPGFCLN